MKTRSIKKVLISIASLIVLLLIVGWMAGMFHKKIVPGRADVAPRSLPKDQPLAEVHRVTERVTETVIGTVVAERKTTVSSKILATIQSIKVSAGSNVKQGDPLVELDARDLKAQVQQAADALSASQASLTQARLEYERRKQLLQQNVASKSEFDQAKAQYEIAKANVARASQAKKEAEVALSHSVIIAPITGRVVDRLSEPGDTASPGKPLLTLYDPTAVRLEAPVRESLVTQIHIGDQVKVHIDALNIDLDGRVDEIVPQAEIASRSMLVKVGIPHHKGIFTGLFGRVMIPSGERQRICMPLTAIRRIGQLEYVDVVRADGSLEKRFVQTGAHSENGNVELLSGAQPGEKVVLYR